MQHSRVKVDSVTAAQQRWLEQNAWLLACSGGSYTPVTPPVEVAIPATSSHWLTLNAPVDGGSFLGSNYHYTAGYINDEWRIEVNAREVISVSVLAYDGSIMLYEGDDLDTLLDTALTDQGQYQDLTGVLDSVDSWYTLTIKAGTMFDEDCRIKTAVLTVLSAATVVSRFPSEFSTTLKDLNDAGVRLDGFKADGGGRHGYNRTAPFGNAFRFTAAPTAAKPYIWVYASRVVDRLALFEDGVFADAVLLAPITAPGTPGEVGPTYDENQVRQWFRLSPTSTDGTEHEYEIKSGRSGDNPEYLIEALAGIAPSIYKISVEGFNAASTPAARAAKWVILGDSIAWGMGNAVGGNQFTWESYMSRIVRTKNGSEYSYTQPGYEWGDYAVNPALTTLNPDKCIVASLGFNDARNTRTEAVTKANVYTALHRLLGEVACDIHVLPILLCAAATEAFYALPTYRTYIADVCAGGATTAGTLSAPELARLHYRSDIDFSAYDPEIGEHATDGTHPNAAGEIVLAGILVDEFD